MKQPETTKVICFPEIGRAKLIETVLPPLGRKDVLIKIGYSAISSGTERWILKGQLEIPGEAPLLFPHVPGYQAAGTILTIGTDVDGYREGEKVFSRSCKAPPGWKGSWWGGHCAYHIASTGKDIIRISENVSTKEASHLLLAQVGFNGAGKPTVEKGNIAVVIGDGLVGQFASQVLTYRGAHTILSGLVPERLEMAKKYSSCEVYDNRNFDFHKYIARRFPDGVDIVIDTAGTMKTVEEAAGMLRRHGELVLNGYYPPGDSFIDWHWLRRKELTLHFADSRSDNRLNETMDLINTKAMRVKELQTNVFAPEEAPEAYAMLLEDRQDFLGLVIKWD